MPALSRFAQSAFSSLPNGWQRVLSFGFASLALSLFTHAASAQPSVSLQYESFYNQVTSQPPTIPFYVFAYVGVGTSCEDESASCTITNPSIFQVPMSSEDPASGSPGYSLFFNSSSNPPSEADLFQDLPSGNYYFEAMGDTCSDSLFLNQPFPTGGWPSNVPALTPSGLSALSNPDPSQPILISFNAFSGFAGSTDRQIFAYIYDPEDGFLFSQNQSSFATTTVIPPGTLQPGTTYTFSLRYFNQRDQEVNGVMTTLGFNRTTEIEFTTSGMAPRTCDSLDFNNDGNIDPTDVDAYFSILGEGPCLGDTGNGCSDLDYNNDGNIDPTDVDAYFSILGEGPCL
jgi:hypothetical protein